MKCCKTCKWSAWDKTERGRLKVGRHDYGVCMFSPKMPRVPQCVQVQIRKWTIRIYNGRDCPCYEPKKP